MIVPGKFLKHFTPKESDKAKVGSRNAMLTV